MSSSPETARFTVTLRGISPDLQEVGAHHGEHSLSDINAAQLTDILARISQVNPLEADEADLQVSISGRRGRFALTANGDKHLLRPADDLDAAYTELETGAVAAWLDQSDGTPAPETAPAPQLITVAPNRKRRAAGAFLVVSLAALVISAYFTFQPKPLIPDSRFSAITDRATLSKLQNQVIGRFANADGDSALVVASAGRMTYLERSEDGVAPDETAAAYTIVTLEGVGPVLRTDSLGAINVKDANTLIFNGEPYRRKN
ncbi:MAG: hypothetical protein R3F03_00020 [Opitutaceae bacterium]